VKKAFEVKRYLLQLAIACVLLLTGRVQAFGDKIPAAEVPKPVLKAIAEQVRVHGEAAKDVERENKDGKVIYDVEFRRSGINKHIKFNEDGSLVSTPDLGRITASSPSLEKLPASVQKTVEQQRAGRSVADIDEENWDGKSVYEVEFKEQGRNSRIYIASDGSLLGEKEGKTSLFKGMPLSETPKPVQDKVKEVVGESHVARITQKTQDGQILYKVDVQQKGQDRRLVIAQDGTLVRDSEALGAPAATETAGEKPREKTRELFSRGETVSLDQTPGAVQKTIKNNESAGVLKSIKKEQKAGATRYDVEFEKAGKNTRLKIGEDGGILEDNRK
jgi:uncharacterized membrane protein YkoI